jgi:group I intron endonuclease
MNIWRNNPKVSGKYNYLYKIENLINGNFYIGIHRTNNLNDDYFGSGTILKRAIIKHGIKNFKKEILEFFNSYEDALNREREIVTVDFLKNEKCYNVKEGGYGNCKMSDQIKEKISKNMKKIWESDDYRKLMKEKCFNNERNKKISEKLKKWIKQNPEKHMERMLKINKNPEKIKKMAETHRGMKRSEEGKKNISIAAKKNHAKNPNLCGKGCIYIYNTLNGESRRFDKNEKIPHGWLQGTGPRKLKK